MTTNEKITMIANMLDIDEDDVSGYGLIGAYLEAAKREIIGWRYSYAAEKPDDVPPEYEMTQIFAVMAGYTQIGAEGETTHDEGSIRRIFKYDTMISYIRSHVIPIVGCI